MSPPAIALIAFGCIFGGLLLGMFLRAVLPEHHLSDESKDALKLGTGIMGTLAALVIGLLIASAKESFDTMNTGLNQAGSKIILVDRLMAHYGPETKEARDLLRRNIILAVEQIWGKGRVDQSEAKAMGSKARIETVQDKVLQLSPQNESQRWLQSQALQLIEEVTETRWLLFQRVGLSSLPMPFFVLLVSWLAIIFFSLGLVSPRNATVHIVLLLCALSATSALYLILEMDRPYGGLIQISNAPLLSALACLGQ